MIETKRLILRRFSRDDADFSYKLNLDPEVIKYTGDPPFRSKEAALRFIEQYDQYRLYGHGGYAVIAKDNSDTLGWCGLKWNADLDEVDLGYRFFWKYWGKGFATEAAMACVQEAYQAFGYPSIIGRAMVQNTSSIRVLQRIGFSFERYISCEGSISEQWRHQT